MSYTLAVETQSIKLSSYTLHFYKLKSGVILASCKDLAAALQIRLDKFENMAVDKQIALDRTLHAIPVEFADHLIVALTKTKLAAVNLLAQLNGTSLAELARKLYIEPKQINLDWWEYRQANQDIHAAFQNHCNSNKLPGSHVHDAMTQLIFGQTATEAKQFNELIGLDPNIGLDHQPNAEGMKMIARMKLKFCTYRSGTWQERVVRSYEDCVLNY